MLIVNKISKSFHKKKVLDQVSFQVNPGQIVILLGQSGVGKSTILRVLNHLDSVDEGSITLGDHALDFSQVGMVFQDFNLFSHLTIEQNLMLPLQHVAKKTVSEASQIAHALLERFDIASKADLYPAALSGGQKQRVAIARALCMKPQVLCMDEPTSALDPQLTAQVAQIITQLAHDNMMVVIATHDIGLVQNLQATVHLMEHGKIIETATTQQLEQASGSFEKIKNFMQGKNG